MSGWILLVWVVITAPSGARKVGPVSEIHPTWEGCQAAGAALEEKYRKDPAIRVLWRCEAAK